MINVISLFFIILGLVNAAPTELTVEKAWEQVPPSLNGTQCMFLTLLNKFTCRGDEIIECDAVNHLVDVPNKVFGLGRMPAVKGELTKYWMYPRVENSTFYLNHHLNLNTTNDGNVVLYHGDKFVDIGVRVKDLKCYQRLVNFLDSITVEHEVELDSTLTVKPKISIFSEVLLLDNPKVLRRSFFIENLGFLNQGLFNLMG